MFQINLVRDNFFKSKGLPDIDFDELEERNIRRIENMIRHHVGVDDGGLASQWDYETRTWKKSA